uniref:CLAVATA3/ESR (CLE)-related protein 9 n=1 Tax=Kalanchoe fedtschenkoi TaxID=63787 RepID=A0A7N0TRD9_KALFE
MPNPARSRSPSLLLIITVITTILCFLISSNASDIHRRRRRSTRVLITTPTTILRARQVCNAKYPPEICIQLQRMRRRRPPPLPPSMYEVDPKYGVQKRLVPSGPNPLHN